MIHKTGKEGRHCIAGPAVTNGRDDSDCKNGIADGAGGFTRLGKKNTGRRGRIGRVGGVDRTGATIGACPSGAR